MVIINCAVVTEDVYKMVNTNGVNFNVSKNIL